MKAIAVIGAGYGAEGKGLTIDYLARNQTLKGYQPLVARFNGGSQAGPSSILNNWMETEMLNINRSAVYSGIIVPADGWLARFLCAIPFSRFFIVCEAIRVGHDCQSLVRVFWNFSYGPYRVRQLLSKGN